MKSVFYAGAGIQSVLFFLNDGYLSATLACGSGWNGPIRVRGESSRHTGCPTSLYDQRTAVQR